MMSLQLTKGPWRKGATPDPIEYAKLAAIYTKVVNESGCDSTNLILAIHYQVPIVTIKERIKKCRMMGLLTHPGKGIRGKSAMTYRAVEMLKNAEVSINESYEYVGSY